MNETADHEVLRLAADWLAAGDTVTLATVTRTFGSSPRPPGAMAALRGDGHFVGSLSGGCIEYDLVARLRDGRLGDRFPATVTYGITREEATRFGLPCGGKLEVVLERPDSAAPLRQVLAHLDRRELIRRRLCLDTGEASLHPAGETPEFAFDGCNLHKVFGPQWRMLLIGAGQLSRFAAEMALSLGYDVVVCDPRTEVAELWAVPGTTLDTRMPDDAVLAFQHRRSAVLALMHDPKLDDLALLEALAGPSFYVGALGSTANNDRRRARLAMLGLPAASIARLHGPVGLPIGSRTPAEIALAALAGVTAARHGITLETARADIRQHAHG